MHNIVDSLRSVNNHHATYATALRRKSGLDILQPEAHQPVAVLDHNDLYVRIAEDSRQGLAAAIPARAGFSHRFHHPKAVLGGDLRQTASCRSNSAFWSREKTLAYKATPGGSFAGAAWRITVPVASCSGRHGQLASLP